MSDFKHEERHENDGPVRIEADDDGGFWIFVTQAGNEMRIKASQYNAARVFGMLALMLGIPLPAKVGKSIKL